MATGTINKKTATIISLNETGASGITTNGIMVYDPSKNTVRIYLAVRSTTDLATSTVLATIPSGYRPSADTTIQCLMNTSASSGYLANRCNVLTTGVIRQGQTNAMRNIVAFGEYTL